MYEVFLIWFFLSIRYLYCLFCNEFYIRVSFYYCKSVHSLFKFIFPERNSYIGNSLIHFKRRQCYIVEHSFFLYIKHETVQYIQISRCVAIVTRPMWNVCIFIISFTNIAFVNCNYHNSFCAIRLGQTTLIIWNQCLMRFSMSIVCFSTFARVIGGRVEIQKKKHV